MSWTKHCGLWIGLLLSLAASFDLILAQQKTAPTLDAILQRLQSNLDHYDKQVPSFFCNEQAVSSVSTGKAHQTVVTDSRFRVTRTGAGSLTESHELTGPDGTTSDRKFVSGLVTLGGVFSGGLDAVSLKQAACMHYTLQPIVPGYPGKPYVVQFSTLPSANRRSDCVLKEVGSGWVWIDPSTMNVTRMELTAPHHAISSAETGVWRISIRYAQVSLAGQTFWLPSRIVSVESGSVESEKGKSVPTVYSFDARYSDYHKLEVSSRIVPAQ